MYSDIKLNLDCDHADALLEVLLKETERNMLGQKAKLIADVTRRLSWSRHAALLEAEQADKGINCKA
jgi:hypothetical protein